MVGQSNGAKAQFGMGMALLIAFVVIMLLGGGMIVFASDQLLKFVYIVPVIFLFLAITAFLLILLHYAVSLRREMPDIQVTALGLPEGSVRAFLAIGLLALVAVFGAFLYFESKGGSYPEAGIIQTDNLETAKAALGDKFILIPVAAKDAQNQKGVYRVVSTNLDTSRSDLAKQLLVMITTLLTTIVGFYFGSRTGESGAPGNLERRATPLNEIVAVRLRVANAVADLRNRAAKLQEQVNVLQAPAKETAQVELDKLKAKLESAATDLDDAGNLVAAPPADAALIVEARNKAVAAEQALAEVATAFAAGEADLTKLSAGG